MEVKYEALLLLQIIGLFMAYTEYHNLIDCSIPRLIGRVLVIMLPTILYINLQFIDPVVF